MPMAGGLGFFASGCAANLRGIILIGLWSVAFLVIAQDQQIECGRGPEDNFNQERWTLTDDGTVGDQQNGLIWKQCPEGLRGERCRDGRLKYVTWEQALEIANNSRFAGFDDWRIPKGDELRQIIQPGCLLPTVNLALFPNTPSGWFWFDSAEADNSPRAGQLSFAFGEDFSANQRTVVHLRLVREVPEEPEPEVEDPEADAEVDAPAPDADAEPQPDEPEAAEDAQAAAEPDGQAAEPEPAADQPDEPTADQAADQNAEPAAAQDAPDNPDQPADQPAAPPVAPAAVE